MNCEVTSNNLRILCDWVSFTVTSDMTVDSVIEFMGFSSVDFHSMPCGASGYKSQLRHNLYNIRVLYDGNEDMGIHVDVSGSGVKPLLEAFKETLLCSTPFGDGYELFDETVLARFCKDVLLIGKFTRFDVAIDDIGCEYFSTDALYGYVDSCNIVSRFRSCRNMKETDMQGNTLGHTVYFGSGKSSMMLRVYDKQLEQNKHLEPEQEGYFPLPWVRWELELKKERATEFVDLLVNSGKTLASIAVGVLAYYLRLIVRDDSNASRCSIDPVWKKFIDDVERLRLVAPKKEKTLLEKERWVENQVAPSLCVLYLMHYHDPDYLIKLAFNNRGRMSPSDRMLLLNEYPDMYEILFG